MNTYVKLTIAVVISSFVLFFFVFHDMDYGKEALAGDEEVDKEIDKQVEDIKVQELLLPFENSESRTTPISHVMLHFISNVSESPQNPYRIKDINEIYTEYGVSAHYMIDRVGSIYKLVPENRVAYHAGIGVLPNFPDYKDKLNDYSIGIEMLGIGTKEEMVTFIDEDTYDSIDSSFIGFTDVQYESLTSLLENIHERYPDIKRNREHVIGHDEYATGRKSDPGTLFDWNRIGY